MPNPVPVPASALWEIDRAIRDYLTKDGIVSYDVATCTYIVKDRRLATDAIEEMLQERVVLPSHSPQAKASAEPSLPADGNGAAGGPPDLNR